MTVGIAVANQKGGVAKTTTAVNLAADLALSGQRVLLIDLDPQGNAATALGVDRVARESVDNTLFRDGILSGDALSKTEISGLSIMPSSLDLASLDQELLSGFLRRGGLSRALSEYSRRSSEPPDVVLFDCPPALGLLTLAALAAADFVIVPVQAEFFALEGLSQLMFTIQQVQKTLNPDLEIGGVVLTMADPRNRLSREIERDLRETLGPLVFQTVIPRNVRVSEAQSHGKALALYDPLCRAATSYRLLSDEVLNVVGRVRKERAQ